MPRKLLPLAIALPAILLLSGCLGLHFGGGTRTTMKENTQNYDVSLGQQLIDLQKAHDAGIITDSEYNSQKKKLLRHYLVR